MSGITHSWNGTVLTITTDAGTTSVDLKGDTGCRGPQGPHGIVYDADGNIIMEGFATEQYVHDLLRDVKPDMTGYATEQYVNEQIIRVNTGGTIDLGDYATKEYVDNAIGSNGGYIEPIITLDRTSNPFPLKNAAYFYTPNISFATKEEFPFDGETELTFYVEYADGQTDKITGSIGPAHWESWTSGDFIANPEKSEYSGKIHGAYVSLVDTGSAMNCAFRISGDTGEVYWEDRVLKISVTIGDKPSGVNYLDANLIPVDGTTITIVDGKLTVIGGTELSSSEEVMY